jgi:alkylhydroperoxidase/carboxymuconolactone decarboxylase family protein YurZ
MRHKRWGSIVAALGIGIALGLTWSVVRAVQTRGGGGTGGDGGYAEHMVPGDPWPFATWPSHRERGYLKQLANYDAPLHATWGKRLEQGIAHKQLDTRSEMVIVVAMDALAHWTLPVIEQHIEQAFDAGSNISEIMEAMEGVGSLECGIHCVHDAFEGLWSVVEHREKAGKPAPLHGAPLTAKDLIPESNPVPPIFKYHLPHPRYHDQARQRWAPEVYAINARAGAERAKLPQNLSGRMAELLTSASDSVVRWPDPLLDHHMHEALNRGSNVQEITEVIMVVADSVQGASESNVAGRRVASGVEILHHGLSALGRVIAERDKAGHKTPREYGEGFTTKMY